MAKKRADTTITLAPLTVDQALSALLKTPPPAKPERKQRAAPLNTRKKKR